MTARLTLSVAWSRVVIFSALLASTAACHRGPMTAARAGSPAVDGGCRADGGCGARARPGAEWMRGLWAAGPGDLWAVGHHGTILHHDGQSWTSVPSGVGRDLLAVAGRGPGDAWAVGEAGTMVHLQNGRWEKVVLATEQPDVYAQLQAVLVLPSGETWVVGGVREHGSMSDLMSEGCVIGHLRDGVWTFDTDDVACGPLARVWVGSGPDDVWAEGGGAIVHWNGRYLTKNPRQKPAPRRGLHGLASGWRLTVGADGDGPLERAGSAPLAQGVRDFWAFGPDDVWALQSDGLWHFDGRGWTAATR